MKVWAGIEFYKRKAEEPEQFLPLEALQAVLSLPRGVVKCLSSGGVYAVPLKANEPDVCVGTL